ncbi:MAG TPA: hypothetical protein VGQ33_16090 [Vicinamibacteria bacterium]|nr:hypothetical protein [Vicinamibacteria bacterium]
MHLDRLMPDYDVHEVHSTVVRASPLAIDRVLFEVTANEVWLFRALMAVRGLGARGSDGSRPLLETAQEGGFAILAEEPGRELVLGVMGRFWQLRQRAIRPIGSPAEFVSFAEPGFARAAMNFLVEPQDDGVCRLTTETRVRATDARARHAFRAYWTLVHPGSAFIRRMWLRAIRRRAEAAPAAQK